MSGASKVLHTYKVFHPDIAGGVPSAIATLCTSTNSAFANSVLVARLKGLPRSYEINGIPVEAVASFGTLFSTPMAPGYPRAFLERAKSSDIVIHHAPFPLTDIVAHRLPNQLPLVVYWHADIANYPILKKLVGPSISRTLNRADRIVVSDDSMVAASTLLQAFADKCTVVPYGANLNYWSTVTESEKESSARLRQRHPRMILTIGRLVAYKGLASLLQALVDVDGEIVIIGEGPLLPNLKALAEKLGVQNRVTFEGRLESSEIKSYLYAARVLAFPSLTIAEAFGLVQLEAMATGLPIVNTSLPTAVPKIARHDQEALTVAPNSPPALAEALNRILNDGVLAQRLGRAGKSRALSEYSQARYISRIEAIYSELIELRR
jgi:rhamnosyl/mannosyltransferase